MSFEKLIRIPSDRIAVLIGKSGSIKSKIENLCYVSLNIDGDTGEVVIKSTGDMKKFNPLKPWKLLLLLVGDSPLKML